jgi:hypothetical protein
MTDLDGNDRYNDLRNCDRTTDLPPFCTFWLLTTNDKLRASMHKEGTNQAQVQSSVGGVLVDLITMMPRKKLFKKIFVVARTGLSRVG